MNDTQNPYQDLMLKAAQDEAFRERLLQDPRAALEAHLGTALPTDLTITVVENTATELTLVIPPKLTDELSDDQLDSVAGGFTEVNGPFDVGIQVLYSVLSWGLGCIDSAIQGSVRLCRNRDAGHEM